MVNNQPTSQRSRNSNFEHGMLESSLFAVSQLIRKARNARNLWQGKRVHAYIVESSLIENTFLANLLIEMYGKCGSVADARRVFDEIRGANIFSWTNMFEAYAQNGQLLQAKAVFQRLPETDLVCWNSMLQALTANGGATELEEFFKGMPHRDVVSWTIVLATYSQRRQMLQAEEAFEKMPMRDLVAWNAMMQALVECRKLNSACAFFESMPSRDVASWTTVVVANAQSGHLREARKCFENMPKTNVVSWTAIVVAYAENGELRQASKLFALMPDRNQIAWNAMIQAYAVNGHAKLGLRFFSFMEQEGIKPNDVTFISVLTACSHIGLVELGRSYIFSMVSDHSIVPGFRHLSCMIDLFGRAGWLAEGEELANSIGLTDSVVWKSLFASCKVHGDVERGKRIATHVFDHDTTHSSPYVMLSHIFAPDKDATREDEESLDLFL